MHVLAVLAAHHVDAVRDVHASHAILARLGAIVPVMIYVICCADAALSDAAAALLRMYCARVPLGLFGCKSQPGFGPGPCRVPKNIFCTH